MDRVCLERLSTGELFRLADHYGIDAPPGLERAFLIEELLDSAGAEDEEQGEESPPLEDAGFSPPGSLPKQYNITYIEALIRDPLWAFVFWELRGQDRELYENAPDFGGYRLRVSPAEGGGWEGPPFSVPVGNDDGAWYLGFPPAGGNYTVSLCVLRGEEELVLAASRPFRVPKLFIPPGDSAGPLARLSGAGDFPLLRHVDRMSRTLRRSPVRADGDD
jgi:hypothetical protein